MSEQDQDIALEQQQDQATSSSWLLKLIKLLALVLLISALSAGYGYWWLSQWAQTPIAQLTTQAFTVVKGDNVAKISTRLLRQGQFKTIWPLRWLLVKEPKLAKLRIGTYQISQGMSPRQLLTHLSSGKELQFSITFVEGTTFKQWLAQLKNNRNLSFNAANLTAIKLSKLLAQSFAVPDYPQSYIEGQLYPDTYSFTAGTPASDIVKRAALKLAKELKLAWQQRHADLPLATPYQALILASIIEKETGVGSERATIASVFINRIRKRMRLQTDPTVIYGVGDSYNGDITRAHLRDKNRYNTYVIKGLPPTPIAMPGKASIIAALQPATTDYLYFVANGKGGHYFSKTLKEHNKAYQRYLLSNTD